MKPDNVNRWLTLVANIGVLIGILLLVYELAQNRDMMRAQTRNEISIQIADRLSAIAINEQAASVNRRARDGEELTPDEQHQNWLMFVANMRDWENIHYQYRQGMFDGEEFGAERTAWQFVINENQAFQRNWCVSRGNYSRAFVAEIESLLDKPCS